MKECTYCGCEANTIDNQEMPCCSMCKRMKSFYGYDEWLEKIEQILIKDSNMKGVF
jgi:hypothetical protein